MNPRGVTLVAAAAWALAAGWAQAQNAPAYPARPVRMVIHIGPGSSMDIIGRVLAQKLTDIWHQQVVVDNRAGAGGTIGMDVAAKSSPDGYTILFGSASMAIAPSFYKKLPFDTQRDFEPVTQITSRYNVLVVPAGSKLGSVRDVIALARSKPGYVSYGSGGGTGSSDHLAGELFGLMTKTKLLHVPYKSGPQAVADLLSGQLVIYMGGVPVNLPMIKSGKVKALGVSSLKRIAQLPDTPTIAEAGVPGFEVNVWYGLFVPRGTPRHLVGKIAADVARVVQSPEARERMSGLGADAEGTSPAAFAGYFRDNIEKWAKVVKAAGLTPR
jgi:tripartite-type tricarboxylate transporter receptor subunit TctC